MADCSSIFLDYRDKISFTPNQKVALRDARNDIRDKVETLLKAKTDGISVIFHGQGSFRMDTLIKRQNEEHDVDDGIYLQCSSEEDVPSISDLKKWVAEAVKNQTTTPPEILDPCVRIHYKDGHHVDLAIYKEVEDKDPNIAIGSDWIVSDARQFYQWFNGKTSDTEGQLRRNVKYAKAWLAHNKLVVKGVTISILIAEEHEEANGDDESFFKTMKKIFERLDGTDTKGESKFKCFRPTAPTDEDLLKKIRGTQGQTTFMNALKSLIESGEQALNHDSVYEACKRWKMHFDDRFSCANLEEKDDRIKAAVPFQHTGNRQSA